MTTFNNNESGSSVRTKINEAINKVDGVSAFTGDLIIPDKIVHAGDTNTAVRFPAADTVTVETSGVERVRVTSTGNVGIGTSAPTTPLSVSGGFKQLELAGPAGTEILYAGSVANTVGSYMQNNAYYSTNFEYTPVKSASSGVKFGFGGDIAFVANSGLTPGTLFAPTTRMRIDSSGNVGIGTTSPSSALDVVGNIEVSGGVYLGGTAAANLLDDYEEGTWTPVLSDASTGGNLATGTFTGTYTKTGRLVTVNATLTDITTAGMTAGSNLYIRGLPFTTTIGHMGSNMLRSVTYTGQIAPRTLDSLAYLYLYTYETGGAVTPLTVAAISSGVSDIWFTVTYEA